jgi:tripartite-type tricarboxylate transporter receptor subunit TctC
MSAMPSDAAGAGQSRQSTRNTDKTQKQKDAMNQGWKRFTRTAALAIAAAAVTSAPAALQAKDEYPSGNITFVCAFPAGSGADVLVRYFAEKVGPVSGQTIIVENKVGAAGNIAAQYTAKAKPDGYTIFVHAGSSAAATMHLYKKPPIDVIKALRIAATINKQPFMLTVRKDAPWKNVAELTAFLKQKGDKASYASTATSGKVMGEAYKQLAGVTAVEVPYRTGPDTLNDMMSGALDYGMHDPVFALSQMREGRFRILGVSSGERMKGTPDLPTMAEQGVAMDQTGWWAAMVPAATPDAVVLKINAMFRQVLSTPETAKFLNSFGGDVFISTPEEGQKLFVKTADEWEGYVRMAKIPQN